MLNKLNCIQSGLFRSCSWIWGGQKSPSALNSVTYPTMMKLGTNILYLKKIQTNMNHVTHILSYADISIFYRKPANFVISRNTDIDCILIYNF